MRLEQTKGYCLEEIVRELMPKSTGFLSDAQDFAWGHGIYLVTFSQGKIKLQGAHHAS